MMHNDEFAEKMFKDMDANNDGVVTKKDFDAFHAVCVVCRKKPGDSCNIILREWQPTSSAAI